ncbi:MAG: tetratricopeptide repeat protein [Sphingorhabdus sp.]
MLPALLLLLQSAVPAVDKPLPTLHELQFEECLTLARNDPPSAVMEANMWVQQDGGYLAKACHGLALANDFRFAEAGPVFIEAAKGADSKNDGRAARFWAQAGNAYIASGMLSDALSALDTAIKSPTPTSPERADIEVDRARALVGLNRSDEAVTALNGARQLSPENPTAWLLSATLARRMNALTDALAYIQTAATLAPRDAAVALEAGNIAIAAGDEGAARKQWEQTVKIAPNGRLATTAQAQLAALGTAQTPAAPPTQSR